MNEQRPKEKAGAELANYCPAHRDDPEMLGAQVDYVPLGPQGWRRG